MSYSIADLLHKWTSRPKGWRCDIRSTEIVNYDSDDKVCYGDAGGAGDQSLGVLSRIPHSRSDGEKAWCSSVGKNESRDGSDRLHEIRLPDSVVI